MDAFDTSQITGLLKLLHDTLGPEIPEATHEPSESYNFRGGPYLLGDMHRRAWNVQWEKLPREMRQTLDANDLARVAPYPAELIVQWADNLPFTLVIIRAEAGPVSSWMTYASDGLLKTLPGRLGPSNRSPRAVRQLLLCTKISHERMQRIRGMMQAGDQDEALRKDLADGLHQIGKASGSLRLESPFSNVLLVEGEGGWYDESPSGPFRAFVFSQGNLGPHVKREWYVPMWIPPGLGTSDWTFFNFHPFLHGAIRHAHHISIEAGRLDESISKASRMLPGSDEIPPTYKVPPHLHGELVALHTRLQGLSTALHLSSTRSLVSSHDNKLLDQHLSCEVQDNQGWAMVRGAFNTSHSLKTSKLQAEQEAKQVLDGLERRIDRALDLVTSVE